MKKILFLLFLSCANADPIYRWRDAQGHFHYDDAIPVNRPYENINENFLPPVNSSVETPISAKKSSIERRQSKKIKSRRGAKSADTKRKQCRRYDEQLETIAQRLREGYKEPMGNHLRSKRRQLEQRVHDEC